MKKFLNQGISPVWAILAIVVVAVLIATAFLAYGYFWSPEQPETEQPVAQDETADWKTYENEKCGYKIKYPQKGSFVLTPRGPNSGEGADGYMVDFAWEGFNARIAAFDNGRNDKTINELKQIRDFNGFKNVSMINVPDYAEEIIIDGSTAYKWFTFDSINNEKLGATVVLFKGGDYYYTIQFSCFREKINDPCLPKFESKEKEFDLFLSTFKFLGIITENETAGWKTIEIGRNEHIFQVAVGPCEKYKNNDFWCASKRKIKVLKNNGDLLQEINAEPATYFGSTSLKDDQHLRFDDLDFDGKEDLVIWNETSGTYGLSFYDVYLYDEVSKKFVPDKDFSGLVSGYYPKINKEKQEIISFMKSGCCTHWTTTYKILNRVPIKIYEITDESGKITIGELIDGTWVERIEE